MGKFLKGKGASLAKEIKAVPNGGDHKSSVDVGDAESAKVKAETNAKVGARSSFKSFIK